MKKQNGFSLIEGLFVIIILSFLGLAGYLAWSRTTENNNSTEGTETTIDQQQSEASGNDHSSTSERPANEGYIYVADWGVYAGLGIYADKVEVNEVVDTPLANGSSVTFKVKQQFDYYDHSTSDPLACDATRFIISRTTSSVDVNGQDIPYKSGDYYYFAVENPNDECSEAANNAGINDTAIVSQAKLLDAFESEGIKQ